MTHPEGCSGLHVSLGQYSHRGRKAVNQDAMAAYVGEGTSAVGKGVALAIADGISSSDRSQIAAQTAVRALVTDYFATPDAWSVKSSARRVIEATNSWLYAENRRARTSDMNHGMVCTLSALILKGVQAHVFHVGDSRIARVLPQGLEPLTHDHVTVISPQEQYLGRAVGARDRVEIDYRSVALRQGDVFLLTTDGVHEYIDHARVQQALAAPTLDEAARALSHAALEAGSEDNLTVQFLRVDALCGDESIAVADEPLAPPQPLSPGDQLDGFHLLRELHNSHRSQLLLARDVDGNLAVVKIPGPETAENPAYMRRFMVEEWIARRVHSPHVVKAATDEGTRSAAYVAMTWIEGATLRQWMRDNPRPPLDMVRDLAEQIARGLRALHRREMIHQDLRPENVMLDVNGTAVIIDLGSTAVAGLEEAAPGVFGPMPGTFQDTAPEYLSGDVVTWRADQYALGAMVYEMLTGRLPFGAEVAKVRSRRDQQRLKYQRADTGERRVPPWVDFALARACHRDPMRRYDALSEFIADLRNPSSAYRPREQMPLVERNPLRFWQGLALLQGIALVVLLLRLLDAF